MCACVRARARACVRACVRVFLQGLGGDSSTRQAMYVIERLRRLRCRIQIWCAGPAACSNAGPRSRASAHFKAQNRRSALPHAGLVRRPRPPTGKRTREAVKERRWRRLLSGANRAAPQARADAVRRPRRLFMHGPEKLWRRLFWGNKSENCAAAHSLLRRPRQAVKERL